MCTGISWDVDVLFTLSPAVWPYWVVVEIKLLSQVLPVERDINKNDSAGSGFRCLASLGNDWSSPAPGYQIVLASGLPWFRSKQNIPAMITRSPKWLRPSRVLIPLTLLLDPDCSTINLFILPWGPPRTNLTPSFSHKNWAQTQAYVQFLSDDTVREYHIRCRHALSAMVIPALMSMKPYALFFLIPSIMWYFSAHFSLILRRQFSSFTLP